MGETPANDAWEIAKSHPLIVNFEYDGLVYQGSINSRRTL